jgi:hypothetical protein
MDAIETEVRQAALMLALCSEREEAIRKAGTRDQVYDAHLATVRASGALEGALMMRAVRRLYRGGGTNTPGSN